MKYVLKLFVTGRSGPSAQAIKNLEQICRENLVGRYELQVVDVLEEPEQAEAQKILATPTLVKVLPPPVRKIIGDLSQKEQVLIGLDVLVEAERKAMDES